LDWLNNNPFRRVNLLYTPGKEPGTTDLILDTKDRFPLRVYTGYENSGTPSIGSNQYFAGFNWGDAFFLDHQLNYQFTASGDFQSSLSQSVTYDAPLPWRHTFSIIGAYSKTASQDGSPVNSAGYSYQLSPRYKIPLKPVGGMVHSLIAGFDFKRTNNNLEFGGYNVFNTNIDIIQWLAGYEASGHDSLGTTTLNSIFVYSPGGLDGYNSDAAYQQARAGSRSNYVYARGMLERLNRLPADFSLMTRATVQWTDANLQASEQLGAGGWSTVRGYEEGAARGDSGLLFSMELRSPSFSPIHWFDRKSKPEKPGVVAAASLDKIVIVDQLQFLCFWDYGIAQTRYPQPGEIRQENLSGVGAGVRYTVNTWLSLRFDYGWQMINPGVNDPYSSRAYLGAVISY
jgi:hemolysin activation/secretion protein